MDKGYVMPITQLSTRAQLGINAPEVRVEVHLSGGLPAFTVVGLPETAVREARDRVRSAILNSGFEFPARRITVNLAPADLPKEGGRYDLPIAIGILAAMGAVPRPAGKGDSMTKWLVTLLMVGGLVYCGAAIGEDTKEEKKFSFSLKDTDGKTHKLDAMKDKLVVLEWMEPDCPAVKPHYKSKNIQKLAAKYKEKGVVWLSVCSTGGS